MVTESIEQGKLYALYYECWMEVAERLDVWEEARRLMFVTVVS